MGGVKGRIYRYERAEDTFKCVLGVGHRLMARQLPSTLSFEVALGAGKCELGCYR